MNGVGVGVAGVGRGVRGRDLRQGAVRLAVVQNDGGNVFANAFQEGGDRVVVQRGGEGVDVAVRLKEKHRLLPKSPRIT